MLYLLYELIQNTEAGRVLNFLRYPTFRIIAAGVFALLLGMLIGPRLIARLRLKQHGQSNVREDTPDSHQKKKGTPTMGGALILISIAAGTLLFADLKSRGVWVMILLTFSYGFIGFLDDWLKLSKRNSKGLAGRKKMALQTLFFLIAIFGLMCTWTKADGSFGPTLLIDTRLTLPFVPSHWFNPDLGWFYVVFAWIVIVGTSNAVNLTDGLDGLAIVPTIVSAVTFCVLCYVAGTTLHIADTETVNGVTRLTATPLYRYLGILQVPGGAELAVFCASIVGAGISFLWFNTYPASVFMGDIGSLALGGALGGLAVFSKNEVVSAIIHGIFFAEALSVMIQVTSFKMTGKRVFKMAPVHHHFELKGMAEPKIIVRFWIVAILCGGVALLSLKLR
ncbi:phospho-N-acetylmuramoyl-pentapeptide-transferase [Corallococcus sp. AB004]|uniref:phospho-N-acetylmuramoyl-pentapeptide- transferase n=1 Tax=Corallococcus TaxID=83461 RepID=UPI000EA40608|nr:phospho-N-acetylmuramoyl-pentapeptide-transferase [Corallococcus sp. AB038B]NPC68627.1 phospho-N-acetylmuramoyl-pentapeptide-transferase [Corallococcus exiguus]RKI47163.1 phospho-N-acetylmuramoyl-pentapeptide-transferase [Corallococcus sp. AB004]NPD23240.1 phospho-N-acetylmuramoyl-pentapeptide-transferase [Corallococcus exiguus]NRD46311.1 phospho-N-acetylmuramoyl-pentapeptide-transferase [Corallococcus exiguus]RKH98904.1 phospho-N-acetylmuramoyl-pentapeptide-transferase [Corallococcus sp. A